MSPTKVIALLLQPLQLLNSNKVLVLAAPVRKNWSELDLDALEEEWKASDEEEEPAHNREESLLEQAAYAAPVIFATLREDSGSDGWNFDSMVTVCQEWSVSFVIVVVHRSDS